MAVFYLRRYRLVASGDEIYKMFNERVFHPFIIWLGELFSIKTPELKDKGVVGAAKNRRFNLAFCTLLSTFLV
jgi:hypothetical protein